MINHRLNYKECIRKLQHVLSFFNCTLCNPGFSNLKIPDFQNLAKNLVFHSIVQVFRQILKILVVQIDKPGFSFHSVNEGPLTMSWIFNSKEPRFSK